MARHLAVFAVGSALLVLVAAGCAAKVRRAYQGDELPSGAVASLTGSAHRLFLLFYNRTFFTLPESVDDYDADPATSEWELLPGPHTVHTVYGRQQLFMLGGAFFLYRHRPLRQTVGFTAQAGHRYHVDGHIIEPTPGLQGYCAWIEDNETGELVGGAKHCAIPTPTPEPTSTTPPAT